MLTTTAYVGQLAKRYIAEEPPQVDELTTAQMLILLANFILFIPALVVVSLPRFTPFGVSVVS
jgi:hypothetical protein